MFFVSPSAGKGGRSLGTGLNRARADETERSLSDGRRYAQLKGCGEFHADVYTVIEL